MNVNFIVRLIVYLTTIFYISLPSISAAREDHLRPPAFDWDISRPPKYIPNWQGLPEGLPYSVDFTHPPSEPVRWTAEWEERQGVLLAWPVYWTAPETVYCRMVEELQEVGIVYMLFNNAYEQSQIVSILTSYGVTMENIEWLNIPYDSNWTRDYGPMNIWGEISGNWGIVDAVCNYGHNDNTVNAGLYEVWGMDYYEAPILVEGGNLCTDGLGKVFASEAILAEAHQFGMTEGELHRAFQDYLGVELTILPWPPISPHLDMYAKLVDPETWLVGEWPRLDLNSHYMDQLVTMLDTMTASTGNPYTIYRVPQPHRTGMGYWRSYLNAYMQNGKVLVPIYGAWQDSTVLAIFQEALPSWEVIGINCVDFDNSGGAIHCCTKGIAQHDEPHARYLSTNGIQSETHLPTEFSIHRNYPNPFNAETVISYALPVVSKVKLSIYNVTGKWITDLVNEWRDAGFHEAAFDGSHLSAGIYIYRLSADKFTASGKMVLLK